MALTKVIKEDKIEVVGDYKHVQVRTKTSVMEDDVELSCHFGLDKFHETGALIISKINRSYCKKI